MVKKLIVSVVNWAYSSDKSDPRRAIHLKKAEDARLDFMAGIKAKTVNQIWERMEEIQLSVQAVERSKAKNPKAAPAIEEYGKQIELLKWVLGVE